MLGSLVRGTPYIDSYREMMIPVKVVLVMCLEEIIMIDLIKNLEWNNGRGNGF
jgi:hypothetical protein